MSEIRFSRSLVLVSNRIVVVKQVLFAGTVSVPVEAPYRPAHTKAMLAFHAIFSTYGFWLPNDPRGSGSTYVASKELYRQAGKATKTKENHSKVSTSHDWNRRQRGKEALKHHPVVFNGQQALAVAKGFGDAIRASHHRLFACAIMPDHVHAVVAASEHPPRRIVGHLKRTAAARLKRERLHPFLGMHQPKERLPSCWGEGSRIVYLDTDDDVYRTISYVEANPLKAGLRRQRWSFVEAFRT